MKIIINNFIKNIYNENMYITFINYHNVILFHLKDCQLYTIKFLRILSMLIEISFYKEF